MIGILKEFDLHERVKNGATTTRSKIWSKVIKIPKPHY